jgi:hypothetical protein
VKINRFDASLFEDKQVPLLHLTLFIISPLFPTGVSIKKKSRVFGEASQKSRSDAGFFPNLPKHTSKVGFPVIAPSLRTLPGTFVVGALKSEHFAFRIYNHRGGGLTEKSESLLFCHVFSLSKRVNVFKKNSDFKSGSQRHFLL